MADASRSDDSRPRRVDSVARNRSGFGRLIRRAEAYAALNRRVGDASPASARGEIGLACVEDDCLVIAAASSTRATQARLAADEILAAARRWWPEPLSRARVVVTPGLDLGVGD